MEKPFRCAECPSRFGQRPHLVHHLNTVHRQLKPFRCAKCPKLFGHKGHLNEHVRRIHDKPTALQRAGSPKSSGLRGLSTDDVGRVNKGPRPHACTVCNEKFASKAHLLEHAVLHSRTDGFECPVCHVRIKTKGALAVHMNRRHSMKVPSGLKCKSSVKSSEADPMPVKRIKNETTSAEALPDEVVHVPNAQKKAVASTTAKAPPTLVLRLRSTVQFTTSSGRVLVMKNQPASMTFGDFRKLFCIPPNMGKLIVFKKLHDDASGSEQWIVPDDESTILPLVDGRIVAETYTDF